MRRPLLLIAAVAALTIGLSGQGAPRGGLASIDADALKTWLTYLASDDLEGRQVHTEGLGLAASYIARHLEDWGVTPAGDAGSYFQTVRIAGVRTTSRGAVTVEVNGERRTFKDGEGIAFPRNMGGKQTVTGRDVYFAGYGPGLPPAGPDDDAGVDPRGKVVVWLGAGCPRGAGGEVRRLLSARSRSAVEQGAIAVVAPPLSGRGGGRGQPPASGRGASGPADFTSVQRYDRPVPPVATAQDELFEFLFSGAPVPYAELKDLAAKQEPLPRFALDGVTITFDVDPEYTVVSTRLTRNIAAIVEGTDPALKDTYVAFGAHYDHIGYLPAPPSGGDGGGGFGCPGQVRPAPRPDDIVHNGADDDGSGTVALMAVARAFALGPRPKRSLLFVWHTAEETGLQGSRYNADFPVVPNERILAHLNLDMVGRNRCDDPGELNTVYLVGSDRISTDLHNVSEEANAALPQPMTLDYEMNDPADPQSIYTRSDHYSYAAKGIPIIFYTTGLHRDYHYLTDEVEKIEFDKLRRVAGLVYATGRRLADLDRAPVRDHKGPRAVKGRGGRLD